MTRFFTRFVALRAKIIEWMPGSDPGSRFRNLLSCLAAIWSALIGVEIFVAGLGVPLFVDDTLSRLLAFLWMTTAVISFYIVCVGVIFLHTSDRPILGGRLIRDTVISGVFTTVSFALFYRYVGVSGSNLDGAALCYGHPDIRCYTGPFDHLYYSLVTFSTLGYGDMALLRWRLLSAFQAVLGNLHMGIFVGAVFYYLTPAKTTGPEATRSRCDAHQHQHYGSNSSRQENCEPDVK